MSALHDQAVERAKQAIDQWAETGPRPLMLTEAIAQALLEWRRLGAAAVPDTAPPQIDDADFDAIISAIEKLKYHPITVGKMLTWLRAVRVSPADREKGPA